MSNGDKGLGRLPAADERDRLFSVDRLLPHPAEITRTYKYWYDNAGWLDQGNLPQCVEYSWHHFMLDGPIVNKPAPIWPLGSIYHEAQMVDEWPGENYDGTSVRAGAKVLQAHGFIQQYRWAFNLQDMINTVLTTSPIVFGSLWYEQMFDPDENYIVHIGGEVAGGHAYLLNGVNVKTGFFRIKNSWGRSWGNRGHAYISFDDVNRLLGEDGEAAIALENKL